MIAGTWNMQNSKTTSRNVRLDLWTANMESDIMTSTRVVVLHELRSVAFTPIEAECPGKKASPV